MSPVAAPLYYQYGSSLFLKAEEATSVFAEGVAEGAEDGEDDAEEDAEQGNDDKAVASAVRDTIEANNDTTEDMEIAWEVLEVARKILSPLVEDRDARVSFAPVITMSKVICNSLGFTGTYAPQTW